MLIAVTRLPGVHLKQQHAFAIEAELDRLQVGQRPHEESCRDQQHQGDA